MIRLLRAELRRFRLRRAVFVLLLVCVVVPVVVLGVMAWSTRPVSAAELADAQAQVARDLERGSYDADIRRCERNPDRYGYQDAAECEQLGPQVEWYLSRAQLDVEQVVTSEGLAVIVILTGLLMLTATTFAGADWSSGSMSNQLLFEPRRLRIWTAKALAVMLASATTMAVILAGFWAAVLAIARARGLDTSAEVLDSIQWTSLRGVALVAAAALGAYAVTMLFRSTVFTLGAMFALVVGSTVVAAIGLGATWLPHHNLLAIIQDGFRYYREVDALCFDRGAKPEGLDCRQFGEIPLIDGVRFWALPLAVAVFASLWSFRRRDVP